MYAKPRSENIGEYSIIETYLNLLETYLNVRVSVLETTLVLTLELLYSRNRLWGKSGYRVGKVLDKWML